MATALFICDSRSPISLLHQAAAERHGGTRLRFASRALAAPQDLDARAAQALRERGYEPAPRPEPAAPPDIVIALGDPPPALPDGLAAARPIVANWPGEDPAAAPDADDASFRRALRLAERRARLLARLEPTADRTALKRALRAIAGASVERFVAEDFRIDAPALDPADPCGVADRLFRARPELRALPVIERDGAGAGVVTRGDFYAATIGRGEAGRWAARPVAELMSRSAVRADCEASLEEIAELLEERGDVSAADGFLLLRGKRCVGLGDGQKLMQSLYGDARAKQRALRAAERRFHAITDMAGDWFWEVDAQHRFTFLSERFADAPGLEPGSAVGKSIDHLARFGLSVERFRALLEARKTYRNIVHQIVLPDGSIRHWRSSGSPLFDEDGCFVGFHGATTDVTELVEAVRAAERRAAELARSERRFRDIAGIAADWFWERDASFRLTYVSERFQQVTGIAPADILGRRLDEMGLVAEPEDLDAINEAERERRPFRDIAYRVRLPDGGVRYWRTSGAPAFDEQGELIGWRGSGSDATGAREAEAALLAAKDAAEAASRAKSYFLANMSHELRTPLNAVIGFAELLQSEVAGSVSDKQQEYLGDIEKSGRHLLTLITDMLDLAKFEARGILLEEAELRLADAIEQARRMMAPAAEKAGVRLNAEADPSVGPALADPRRIQQILINLLSNAIKFTRPGGKVTLRLRREADGGATLSVADEGIGMTADQLRRAGEPFWQADTGLSRSYEGSGLGLAIVKRLAAAHGATFELESRPDEGATASLRLPAERFARAADGGPASPPSL